MSDAWYYELDGKQTGPVDQSTLQVLIQKNVITHKTLVWSEGLPEWVPASRIKGLVTAPPPMPAARSATAAPMKSPKHLTHPSQSGHAVSRRADHGHAPNTNMIVLYAAGAALVCLLGIGAYFFFKSDAKPTKPLTAAKTTPTQTETKKVEPAPAPVSDAIEPTDPQQKRAWLLARYDREAKASPDAFVRLKELNDSMGALFDDDRDWQMSVKQRRDVLQTSMEKKAAGLAEQSGKNAMKKIDAFDFRGAMAELENFPAVLNRTYASNRVFFYRNEVDKKAMSQLQTAIDQSTALLAKKDFEGAVKAFDKMLNYSEPRFQRQVTMYCAEIADAKALGLNPSEGKVPALPEHHAYFKSDVYIGLNGMTDRYQKAIRAALIGNSKEVLALADIAKYPRSSILYYARGVAESWEGKKLEATRSFQQATRLALPGDAMKSRVLSAEGRVADIDLDFETVSAKCDAALIADPKNADAHFVRGMMYLLAASFSRDEDRVKVGQYMTGARDMMNRAAQLDPDYRMFADGFKNGDAPDKYKVEGMGGNPYLPSVVQVMGPAGNGSGWCVKSTTDTAYIITNNHVVEGQENDLRVVYQVEAVGTLVKKTLRKVKVLKTDATNDLALLEIQPEKPIKALTVRQTVSGLRVPMPVTLIGSPGANGITLDFTVMSGEISSLSRSYANSRYLQFNANADQGMSGGPVIDEKGNVIGVIVIGFADIKGQGLAIIAEHVRDICKDAGITVELKNE